MISLDMATNLKQKGHKVKLGQKLCRQYINKYEKIMNEPEEITIDENETKTEEELQIQDDSAEYEESPRRKLNTSLESVGVSPINVHTVPQHSRPTRAKEKLKSVMEKYQESISDAYDVSVDVIKEKPKDDIQSETTKKADELDKLHIAMKKKLTPCSYPQKIQLLTLVPDSWS